MARLSGPKTTNGAQNLFGLDYDDGGVCLYGYISKEGLRHVRYRMLDELCQY